MSPEVLIDGVDADGGWLEERAFQFGDGLFETIAVRDGEPCLWEAHLMRLAEGCRRLVLPLPDFGRLAKEGQRLCAGRKRAVLKIFWTAGRSERGYRRPAKICPQRILRCSKWPETARKGGMRQCSHRLSENPALAGIKHLNRLDQVLARSEWDDSQVSEGLMLGQDGRVVSGTMSNIFLQREQTLLTPAIEGAGIAGVVRALALQTGESMGAPVLVDTVSLDDVIRADALFLTNSLIGVVRVSRFEGVDYEPEISEHPAIAETRRLCHRTKPWGNGHE